MTGGASGGPTRDDPRRRPRAKQPVSQHRYFVRRFVVLAAVGLMIFGVVKVVATITEEDPVAGGDTAATAAPAASPAAVATTVAAVVTPPPTEAPQGPPTADDPANVLIIGDSDAGTFGPYLEQLLSSDDPAGAIVETTLDYKVSSGLARPDFFDWPRELERQIAEVDPDIVIATFGGNDSQGLSEPCADGAGTCSPEWVVTDPVGDEADWTAEYVARVNQIVDLALGEDRYVIWVGIPNDDNPDVTARLRIQDQAVRQALEGRERVTFVDTWDLFDGLSGGYAAIVPDPRDGKAKPIRASDGFHLNQTGAEILALSIYDELTEVLTEMGATLET
jgi:hypothetical protein